MASAVRRCHTALLKWNSTDETRTIRQTKGAPGARRRPCLQLQVAARNSGHVAQAHDLCACTEIRGAAVDKSKLNSELNIEPENLRGFRGKAVTTCSWGCSVNFRTRKQICEKSENQSFHKNLRKKPFKIWDRGGFRRFMIECNWRNKCNVWF